MNSSRQVGLVGLGLLGSAIAERLMAAGFRPSGFDIEPAANAAFERRGGHIAGSIAEIAMRCDPLVLAVYNTEQVEAVVEDDILPAVGPGSGKIILCASTCDPDRIATLAQRVAARWSASPGDTHLRHERTGAERRRGRVDRRRPRDAAGCPRDCGSHHAHAFSHGRRRQRRPRQARHQSHPRPQSPRARGRPRLRRAHGT